MATPSKLLSDHHREVEAAGSILRSWACGDDPLELIAAYRRFETEILAHFEAEEELVLPAYAEHFPVTARRIRETHESLRRRMLQTAIDVELHAVRVEQIDELLDHLRSHAAFEDRTLYRWLDGYMTEEATSELAARIDGSNRSLRPTRPTPVVEHTGYTR